MEKWDLYDEERKLLNKVKNRGELLEEGEYHIVVGIWTFNSQGELLVTLRHPDKEYSANLWENTGGCIQAGETSRQGAVRELFEETGIKVREEELIFIDGKTQEHVHMDAYMAKVDISTEELVFQDGETVDGKWVSMETFNSMVEEGLFIRSVAKRFEAIKDKLSQHLSK